VLALKWHIRDQKSAIRNVVGLQESAVLYKRLLASFLLSAVCSLLCLKLAQAATLPATLGWFSIPGTAYSNFALPGRTKTR